MDSFVGGDERYPRLGEALGMTIIFLKMGWFSSLFGMCCCFSSGLICDCEEANSFSRTQFVLHVLTQHALTQLFKRSL